MIQKEVKNKMEKHHAFWWAIIVVAGLFTGLYGIELLELSQSTQLQLSSAGDSLTGFAVSDGVTGYAASETESIAVFDTAEDISDGLSHQTTFKYDSKAIIDSHPGKPAITGKWEPSGFYFKDGENYLITFTPKSKSDGSKVEGELRIRDSNLKILKDIKEFTFLNGGKIQSISIPGGKSSVELSAPEMTTNYFVLKIKKAAVKEEIVEPPSTSGTGCPISLSNYDVNKNGEVNTDDLTELNAQLGSPLITKESCPAQAECPATGEVASGAEEIILPECTKEKQYELMKTGNLNSICFVETSGKSYWKACTSQGDTYGNYLCVNNNWQDISGIGKILGSAPKTGIATTPALNACTLGEKGTGANVAKVCDGTKFVACDTSQHQKAYKKYYCNQNVKAWAECGVGSYKEGYVVASKKYVCIKSTKGTFSWEDITGIGKILGSAPKTGKTATPSIMPTITPLAPKFAGALLSCANEADCKKNVGCNGKEITVNKVKQICLWSNLAGDKSSKEGKLCSVKQNQCVTEGICLNVGPGLGKNPNKFCLDSHQWAVCNSNQKGANQKLGSSTYVCDGTSWKVEVKQSAATLSPSSIVKVDLGKDVTKGWLHIGGKNINYFTDVVPTKPAETSLKFTLPYTIGKNEIFFKVKDVDKIGSLVKMDGNAALFKTPGAEILGLQTNINVGNAKNKDGIAKFVFAGDEKEHTLSFDLGKGDLDDLEINYLYVKTGIINEESIGFGNDLGLVRSDKLKYTYKFDSTFEAKPENKVVLRFWVMGMDPDFQTTVNFNEKKTLTSLNEALNLQKQKGYTETTDLIHQCKARQQLKNYVPVSIDISGHSKPLGTGKNSIEIETFAKKGVEDNFYIGRVEVIVNGYIAEGFDTNPNLDLTQSYNPADHTGKFISLSGGGC